MPVVVSLAAQKAHVVTESVARFMQGSSRSQLAPDDGVMGWTGILIIYVQKKKKSGTRKLRNACFLEEEVAEEMSSRKSVAGGNNDTLTTVADQWPSVEDPSGPLKDMEMI